MKTYLVSIVMLMFCGLSLFADSSATCKISGSQTNSSVVVSLGDYDSSEKVQTVIITNDDENNAVNVTFTVGNNWSETIERTVLAYPWATKEVKIKMERPASYVKVSGARCGK